MIAILKEPLMMASGKIAGLAAGYHARTNKKTGRVTIARSGNPNLGPVSPARLAARERFAEMARRPRKKKPLSPTPFP